MGHCGGVRAFNLDKQQQQALRAQDWEPREALHNDQLIDSYQFKPNVTGEVQNIYVLYRGEGELQRYRYSKQPNQQLGRIDRVSLGVFHDESQPELTGVDYHTNDVPYPGNTTRDRVLQYEPFDVDRIMTLVSQDIRDTQQERLIDLDF